MTKIQTAECIGSKCTNWSKCSQEKEYQENYARQRHKPIPEWVCKYPYPGANPDPDDILVINNWDKKKFDRTLKQRKNG